jgi:hypothetical protein
MRTLKRGKDGRFVESRGLTALRVVLFFAIVGGIVFVVNTQGSKVEYKNTPTVEHVVPQISESNESTTERARKQMEEATNKLNEEEKRLLDELAQASSTASAEIARIQSEFDAVRAEKSTKLDEINAVRKSF